MAGKTQQQAGAGAVLFQPDIPSFNLRLQDNPLPVVVEFQDFLGPPDNSQDENQGDRRQGFLGMALKPVGGGIGAGSGIIDYSRKYSASLGGADAGRLT